MNDIFFLLFNFFFYYDRRFDPTITTKDFTGNSVVGAYVVDAGTYSLFVGDCVSVGQVWDDSDTCPTSRQLQANLTIPAPSQSNGADLWVFV